MSAEAPEPGPPPADEQLVERLRAHAPKKSKKASRLDKVRVPEMFRRIAAGEPTTDAAFAVMSDAVIGIPRWKRLPAGSRPEEALIWSKFAAMTKRVRPEIFEQTRDFLIAGLASVARDAIGPFAEIARGEFDDPARARVMQEAHRTAFAVFDVGVARGPQVQTAVQVNIDARRQVRDDVALARALILADPEAAEHARALGIRMARVAGRDGGAADAPSS